MPPPPCNQRREPPTIAEREGRANLHFTLNEPAPVARQLGKNGKAKEVDVVSVRGVYVDLDPKGGATEFVGERARLLGIADELAVMGTSAPTLIVDSGNGIQAFWLFPEPLSLTPDVQYRAKEKGKALAKRFSGDAIHNLDRLMRVPFTTNLPNRKKRDKGRVASSARVRHLDWSQRTTLEALAQFAPPVASTLPDQNRKDALPDLTGIEAVIHAPENLPPDLRSRLERLVAPGGPAAKAAERAMFAADRGDDRSQADFALACRLVELGVTDPVDLAFALAAYGSEKVERDAEYVGVTVMGAMSKVGEVRERFDDLPDDAPRRKEAERIAAGTSATPFRFPDPASFPPRDFLYGSHYIRRYVSSTVAPT